MSTLCLHLIYWSRNCYCFYSDQEIQEAIVKFNEVQQEQNVRGELKEGDVINMDHIADRKVVESMKKPGMKFQFLFVAL